MVVERGSNKHGHLRDEQLKHEVEGMMRAGHSTHAQEWADPEPSADDDPDVDRAPHGGLVGGVPQGVTPEDVEGRSELARHLPPGAFPATAEQLREYAARNQVPDQVMATLETAPSGYEFVNVGELWVAIGGGREEPRGSADG